MRRVPAGIVLGKQFHIIPPTWINRFGLQKILESISVTLAGVKSIILIDDCFAKIGLDRRRSALAILAILGRHRSHSLLMIAQRYTAIPWLVRD